MTFNKHRNMLNYLSAFFNFPTLLIKNKIKYLKIKLKYDRIKLCLFIDSDPHSLAMLNATSSFLHKYIENLTTL